MKPARHAERRLMLNRCTFLGIGAAFAATEAIGARAESVPAGHIPFTLVDGFITFSLAIHGIERPLIGVLNTGFTVNFIDSKRWKAFGGRPIAHAAQRPAIATDAMHAGATPLSPSKIAIVDGVDTDDRKIGAGCDVLVGFDAFAGRVLAIDFPKRMMSLRPSPVPNGAAARAATVLTYEQYQPQSPKLLTFDGFAFDGMPIAVQLDTMWTGNAILFPTKFPRTPHFVPAGDATRTYEEGRLRAVRVDAVSFESKPFASDVTAYVPNGKASVPTTRLAGVIGTQLLRDRVVTLDFVKKNIAIA